MGRLIDADEMLDNEAIAYMKAQNSKTISALTMQVNKAVHAKIQMLIADTPTVDAKPVVHCKDCVHWGTGVAGETEHVKCCEYGKYMVGENGYCCYADMRGGKNE